MNMLREGENSVNRVGTAVIGIGKIHDSVLVGVHPAIKYREYIASPAEPVVEFVGERTACGKIGRLFGIIGRIDSEADPDSVVLSGMLPDQG